jgi:hypothetical protein
VSDPVLLLDAWPVVVLVCPTRVDLAWVHGLDAQFGPVFARREVFAVITDTRPIATLPSAVERRALIAWTSRADHLENQKRWNAGSSTIVGNAVVRGTLQALYWFWTPPAPQHVGRDFADAWAWCVEKLRSRNVPLPVPEHELKRRAEAERRVRRTG